MKYDKILHTIRMLSIKKFYSIVCAICLFSLPACAGTSKRPPPPTEERKVIFSPPSSREKKSDELWDVSDVDISKIKKGRNLIAFTFDDAPTGYLENLIATFASFNEANPEWQANATVFFNGYRLKEYSPTLLSEATTFGFELGNHTYSHADLSTLDDERLRREIDEVDLLLEKQDHKPRHLLRAPYGKLSERVKALAQTPIIDWTIDTLDWAHTPSEEIVRKVEENIRCGDIILCHDFIGGKPSPTPEALRQFLPDLLRENYEFVTVSELIHLR